MRPPVQIRVKGIAPLKTLFGKVKAFGADPTELLDIWGGLLEASTRRRFDTGIGVGGIPWPVSRRAAHDGGKTLVDKGNLESSIRFETRPGQLEVGVDGVGASSKHAASHQFGVTIYPVTATALKFKLPDGSFRTVDHVTIPARPFVGMDDEDKADMKLEAVEYLRRLTDGGP